MGLKNVENDNANFFFVTSFPILPMTCILQGGSSVVYEEVTVFLLRCGHSKCTHRTGKVMPK